MEFFPIIMKLLYLRKIYYWYHCLIISLLFAQVYCAKNRQNMPLCEIYWGESF